MKVENQLTGKVSVLAIVSVSAVACGEIGNDIESLSSADSCCARISFHATDNDENIDIFVMNADGSNVASVTDEPGEDSYPTFSSDCLNIAFVSFRDRSPKIYVMGADGSDPTQLMNNDVPEAAIDIGPLSEQGARQILERAIAAHGGYDALRAASTWTGEVRRFQRGGHYEMTNIYRPGMIRLEQDMPDGGRSADVIGHPHCWGKHGPFSLPCSPETRENDRPRVVMEMAAQLWTVLENDWQINDRSVRTSSDGLNTFVARYLPLNTDVTFGFDSVSNLLSYMTVDGTKDGVYGTHRHEYSNFRERCGALMPFGNVKSFEGEEWVREEFLSLRCEPVEESLFVRPAQVENGFTRSGSIESATVACSESAFPTDETIEQIGPGLQLIESTGHREHCVPVSSGSVAAVDGVSIRHLETREAVEAYFVNESEADYSRLLQPARQFAAKNGQELGWPLVLHQFDNDGMGLTGEIVIVLAAPVESSSPK